MFDLEQAISEWRQQLAAGGLKTPDVLHELESHLRDDIEGQIPAGVSEQRAFDAAVERLGQGSALKAEFGKVADAAGLRLQAVACAGFGLLYLTVASYGLVKHEMPGEEKILGLVALVFTLLTGLGVHYAARRVQAEKRTRTAIGVGSGVLALVWLTSVTFLILPRVEFTIGQLVVALLWAIVPMVAGGALALGLGAPKLSKRGVSAV